MGEVLVLSIRRGSASDTTVCRSIAASLPEYFTAGDLNGIARDAETREYWFAERDEGPTGFIVVERRSRPVAEVLWMATAEKSRRQDLGSALLAHVTPELSRDGVHLVEVNTLDASAGYEPYESTHAFWRRHGFVQVDTIDPLPDWRPGHPAAIYVAALTSTR